MGGTGSGRERLMAAGLTLFAEHGFAATTVEELVGAAGVSPPVLYHHFGTKVGLYVAVAERVYAQVLDRHEAVLVGEPTFGEAINRLMDLAIDLYREQPPVSPMMLAALIDMQRDPELAERLAGTVRSLPRFYERLAALAPLELRPTPAAQRNLARALVTVMNGLDLSSVIVPSAKNYIDMVGAVRDLLLRGTRS